MPDLECHGCSEPLTGRQKKWCADPECKRAAIRWAWILKVYGLKPEDYIRIIQYQDYKCAVCRKSLRGAKTPHIDHEHGGHVRGIVCAYCNTRLIGRLKKWELAQSLADYLRTPPAVSALGKAVIAPGRPPKKRRRK